MARHKNANWTVGDHPMIDGASLTVLMDLRDELQALNAKLAGVGPTVHEIARNTAAARRCSSCGAGPYATARGLRQHYRRVHRSVASA